jgi:hypothetical protein
MGQRLVENGAKPFWFPKMIYIQAGLETTSG